MECWRAWSITVYTSFSFQFKNFFFWQVWGRRFTNKNTLTVQLHLFKSLKEITIQWYQKKDQQLGPVAKKYPTPGTSHKNSKCKCMDSVCTSKSTISCVVTGFITEAIRLMYNILSVCFTCKLCKPDFWWYQVRLVMDTCGVIYNLMCLILSMPTLSTFMQMI